MTRRNENGISMNRAFAKLLSDGGEVERLRAELDAMKAELQTAKAEIMRLRVYRCDQDCRYTMGTVADTGGSHCPTDKPCARCETEHEARAFIARVKRLRAGLIRLRDCDWVITLPDRMDAVRDIARETLEEDENANHP